MSLTNNKDEIKKWKDKYYNSLDEQEKNEQLFQEKESLLSKIVTRLALVAKGNNPNLDPHLDKIQELTKKSASIDKLKAELDKISDALLHQADDSQRSEEPSDFALLFDFLEQQYSGNQQLQTLRDLKEKAQHQVGVDYKDLLQSILKITQVSSTHIPADSFKDDATSTSQINTDIVSQQLLHLLAGTKIPEIYVDQVNHLKHQFQTELGPEAFKSVLEKSVALLLNIKQHASSEQQEFEEFLASITQQLAELGTQASSASAVSQENALTRNKLDQSVSRQMKDLQLSSENVTSLASLKQLITTSLEDIARQMNEHQQEEDDKLTETHKQLEKMTSKIQVMESESEDLKYKLQIARDKALRDPLTGLPNRLAYEERLATESARWRRYQTPLTMIIWDIDHFKKINDNYGHKAGDKTLLLVASLLDKNCRQTDFVARFGGEEFIMLLPDTSKESGLIVAEKIRTIIEKSAFNAGGKAVSVTISCGITQFLDADSSDSLFERADKGLYSAKNKGRNQCIVI
jgi:diguanylate cyclase